MVSDGREALVLLDDGDVFDLILMDMYMPNMDGIEATRRIREAEKRVSRSEVPVFGFTAAEYFEQIQTVMSEYKDNEEFTEYSIEKLKDTIIEVEAAGTESAGILEDFF